MQKKLSLILIIGLLVLISCNKNNVLKTDDKDIYTLVFEIENINLETVYLYYKRGQDVFVVDSSNVIENKISYTVDKNAPIGVYNLLLGYENNLSFIFDKEDVSISADYNDVQNTIVVNKGEINRAYFEYLNDIQLLMHKIEIVHKVCATYDDGKYLKKSINEYSDLRDEALSISEHYLQLAGDTYLKTLVELSSFPVPDIQLSEIEQKKYVIDNYFYLTDFTDTTLLYAPMFINKIFDYVNIAVMENMSQPERENAYIYAVEILLGKSMAASPVVHEFIIDYLTIGFESIGQERVLQYMAENYIPETECINENRKKEVYERLNGYQVIAPGKSAPLILGQTLDNKELNFISEQKKATLVIFWASWCDHCKLLIPDIATYYNSLENPNFEVFTISIDKDLDEANELIINFPKAWYNQCDLLSWENENVINYNVYSSPSVLLIDNEGYIILKSSDLNEIRSTISNL